MKTETEIEVNTPEYVKEVHLVKYPFAGYYLQEKHPEGLNAWKLFICKSKTKEAYIKSIIGRVVTIGLRYPIQYKNPIFSGHSDKPKENAEHENKGYIEP